MLVTVGGRFTFGPAAGTSFDVSFFFDAPAPSGSSLFPCCGAWPISLISLNVGGNEVLEQPNPGVNFVVDSGFPGYIGAAWTVPAQVLPAGLISWTIHDATWFSYFWPFPGGGEQGITEAFTRLAVREQPPPTSVPEPATLLYGLLGVAVLEIRRRRVASSGPTVRRQ